jgi:hypothetical protein
VSFDSEIEEFAEFEPMAEVEPMLGIVDPGEVDFEDLEADKPRKKQRLEGNNSDTSDPSGDFEIIDLTEDDEEDLYEAEDPCLLLEIRSCNTLIQEAL